MAEENKEGNKDSKLSFKTADELSTFLMDLQGQIATMQETIDKLSPVEGAGEGTEGEDDGEDVEEQLSDEEVNEIDQLLQSE